MNNEGKHMVLVVDDETVPGLPEIAKAGFRVYHCRRPSEASRDQGGVTVMGWQQLLTAGLLQEIDLIIMDGVLMDWTNERGGQTNGLELIKELREKHGFTKKILAGSSNGDACRLMVEMGADDTMMMGWKNGDLEPTTVVLVIRAHLGLKN